MNSLVIPPSPNWYESTVFTCTVDNTVIYGSRSDIVVIKPTDLNQPANIKILIRAHQDKVISLAVSPVWEKKKLAASLALDKTVKLWNMEEYSLQLSHRAHTANASEVVGLTFAGNDRIVSVSVDGMIVVWRFGPNELIVLKELLGVKPKVTCISACPHLNWLVAFGMHSGLVIVTDLRKNGKVLYKLRRHDEAIVSFSWCPVQYNILQKEENVSSKVLLEDSGISEEGIDSTKTSIPENSVSDKSKGENNSITSDASPENSSDEKKTKTEIIVSTEDDQKTHSESLQVESKKTNPWALLKHVDDQKVIESRPIPRHFDVTDDCFFEDDCFSEDCKQEILSLEQKIDTESKIEDQKLALQEEGKDDFLAACAVLKEQILLNKDDNSLEEPNAILMKATEQLQTINVKKLKHEKENTKKDKIENESLEKVKKVEVNNTITIEKKGKTEIECEANNNCSVENKNIEDQKSSNENTTKETAISKIDDSGRSSVTSDTKELLLASSSKTGNVICIWSIGKHGRLQAELHLPGRSQTYRKKVSSNSWIALLWLTPNLLLSSSKQGELLSWNLKRIEGKGRSLKPSLIHNDHSSQLFCIAAPIEYDKEDKEENWRKGSDLRVWTMGQDRNIINTNLGSSREVLISYPTIGGPVQCLIQSPLDPNRIAIGVGDGTTSVWDLSKPHLQCVTMTKLWQRMSSKILALAWHPVKEAILAYGTYEGRIGLVDTLHLSKSPVLMTQYFNKGIYQLQWGPLKNDAGMGLYACSEGKLVVYNSEKSIEDPYLIPTSESEQITQFSWNHDYSIIVLGAKSGTLFFYTPDFQLLHTVYNQQKAVQCLMWHPEACVKGSNYFAWLASSTNDNNFVVYNCSHLFNSDENCEKETSIVADLLGHSSSVKCISWSPHEGDKLVSVGEDSVAQVWNVSTKTIIGTYLGHGTDGILTVLWSPLDPDFIITGGRDNTIRIWKISECQPMPVAKLESVIKTKNKCTKSEKVEESQTHVTQTSTKTKKVLDSLSRVDGGAAATLVDECRRLFYSQQEIKHSATNGNKYRLDTLDIFKSRDDVLKLLSSEEAKYLKSGKKVQAHHISLWKGNIAETIKRAVADGTVTPFLISLAPMVSPKLWQKTCEVYSNKLIESSNADPLEVAAYFLACHKIEQAVEALITGGLFREALALAKSRLGEKDSLVSSILERWATSAMFDGNFEIAAQCYITLGKLEDAVKLLFRRSDETTLKLALDIAEYIKNDDLYKAVLTRYKAFKSESNKENTETPVLCHENIVSKSEDCSKEEEH